MASALCSIDPGNKGGRGVCALAHFVSSTLVALQSHSHEDIKRIGVCAREVALEVPVMYPGGHERPNDLIQLGIAGALAAAALRPSKITMYTPAQWKGQKAKPACHLILWEKMSPAERALLPEDTYERIMNGVRINAPRMYAQPLKQYAFAANNLLDAIGIGFHHLGR